MKSFNEFLNEGRSIEESIVEIDASSAIVPPDIISVELGEGGGENNEEDFCFTNAHIGETIIVYHDLDIDPEWYNEWHDDKKSKMNDIYRKADKEIYSLYAEMINKVKSIVKEASEKVNKLDENWKRNKKYNL